MHRSSDEDEGFTVSGKTLAVGCASFHHQQVGHLGLQWAKKLGAVPQRPRRVPPQYSGADGHAHETVWGISDDYRHAEVRLLPPVRAEAEVFQQADRREDQSRATFGLWP